MLKAPKSDAEIVLDYILKQEWWFGLTVIKVCRIISKMPDDIKRELQAKEFAEDYRVPYSVIRILISLYKYDKTESIENS